MKLLKISFKLIRNRREEYERKDYCNENFRVALIPYALSDINISHLIVVSRIYRRIYEYKLHEILTFVTITLLCIGDVTSLLIRYYITHSLLECILTVIVILSYTILPMVMIRRRIYQTLLLFFIIHTFARCTNMLANVIGCDLKNFEEHFLYFLYFYIITLVIVYSPILFYETVRIIQKIKMSYIKISWSDMLKFITSLAPALVVTITTHYSFNSLLSISLQLYKSSFSQLLYLITDTLALITIYIFFKEIQSKGHSIFSLPKFSLIQTTNGEDIREVLLKILSMKTDNSELLSVVDLEPIFRRYGYENVIIKLDLVEEYLEDTTPFSIKEIRKLKENTIVRMSLFKLWRIINRIYELEKDISKTIKKFYAIISYQLKIIEIDERIKTIKLPLTWSILTLSFWFSLALLTTSYILYSLAHVPFPLNIIIPFTFTSYHHCMYFHK